MSLLDLLLDLSNRFNSVSQTVQENRTKVNSLNAQIEAVNNYYAKLHGHKPRLVLQSIVLFILSIVIGLCIYEYSDNWNAGAVFILVLPIPLVIINIIRGSVRYSIKKRRAANWWEQTGKNQALTLTREIETAKVYADPNSFSSYLSENTLYQVLPPYRRNSADCYRIYKLAVQRGASTMRDLEAVFYLYDDIKDAEYEHEEMLDAINSVKEANEKLLGEAAQLRNDLEEKRKQEDFDRMILDLKLSEIRYRNSD